MKTLCKTIVTTSLFYAPFFQIAFAEGVWTEDYHNKSLPYNSNVVYNTFAEDFRPTNKEQKESNVGTWRYSGAAVSDPSLDYGVGTIVKTDSGKYAVEVGTKELLWGEPLPVFGTHATVSPFTGDFLAKQVVSISFTARVLEAKYFNGEYRPITIVLEGSNGLTLYKSMQPCEPKGNDVDCYGVPLLPKDFTKYTFSIPSTGGEAMAYGWKVFKSDNVDEKNYNVYREFKDIMKNIKRMEFMYGSPTVMYGEDYYIIQATDVTISQIRKR